MHVLQPMQPTSLAAMAARATRSASRAASSDEGSERCLLLALSHDELGVVVDGLADPLRPAVAVALSSTCLGLRTPLLAALEVLKERHARAVALCRKVGTSCTKLSYAEELTWTLKGLTAADMATLGMLLSKWLPRLHILHINRSSFGDVGMQALCEGLGPGAAPSLCRLNLGGNKFGPVGAEALAAALRRGAMAKLEELYLSLNPIGNQGVAALAISLRKLLALSMLDLSFSEIGDEGVASLVDDLGKDDFKALKDLWLWNNKITDAGCAALARVRDAPNTNVFPKLEVLFLTDNPASAAALQVAKDALGTAP